MSKLHIITLAGIDCNKIPFQEVILKSRCQEYVQYYQRAFSRTYPEIKLTVESIDENDDVAESEATTERLNYLVEKCRKEKRS